MRAAVVLIVLLNVYLGFGLARLAEERDELVSEKAGLESAVEEARISGTERSELVRLLETFGAKAEPEGVGEPLGIARLRDELIGAERGLALDRLSLDFRPEPSASAGGLASSRVEATLRGSFESIFDYLARVEEARLPLAALELVLRDEDRGDVAMTVRWMAAWPVGPSKVAGALSPAEVARLSQWLLWTPPPTPTNPFRRAPATPVVDAYASDVIPPPAFTPASPPSEAPVVEEEPRAEPPALTGFVLARPELEPDASRRVLAALRFEEALHLVAVGDVLDGYRVEAITARESVTLGELSTGERLVLRLE